MAGKPTINMIMMLPRNERDKIVGQLAVSALCAFEDVLRGGNT